MATNNLIFRRSKAVRAVLAQSARTFAVLAVAASLLFVQTAGALAAGLIRDSEIEHLISDYAAPIFREVAEAILGDG